MAEVAKCFTSILPQVPKTEFAKGLHLPEDPVVKNLPANAGDTGSIPVREDSPAKPVGSTAAEAGAPWSLCFVTRSSHCSPQPEKARTQQQGPRAAKTKKLK